MKKSSYLAKVIAFIVILCLNSTLVKANNSAKSVDGSIIIQIPPIKVTNTI